MSHAQEVVTGRYRLLDRIGSGGMGQVWLAWDERLNRAVALKRLHAPVGLPDSDVQVAHERAMREARITASLHHPNAVPVYDVVDHEGSPCLVMQYLPSRSLHEILAADGPLDPREVARIGAGIAGALAAAHDAGIVHRDVKPGNILITTTGTPLLTDFGISRARGDASLTATGLLTGTPAYLAPEVARGGDSTPAADVFALGATLYAAVEGTPPFGVSDNQMALLHRVASGRIEPPRRAGSLEAVLVDLLAADPEARPSTAAAARALAAVARGASQTTVLPTPGVDASDGSDASDASGPAAASEVPSSEDGRSGHTAVLPVAPPPGPGPSGPEPSPVTPPVPPPDASPQVPREGSPEPEPEPDRGRRRAALLLAVAGVVAALVVAVVVLTRQTTPGDVAPDARASSSSPSPSASSPTPARTSSPATSSAPSPSSPSPSPSPSSSTPTRPPRTTAAPGPVTDARLAAAVRDYYAVLPADTDTGWARLTPRYRSTTSGSRATYDRFWGAIDRVRVSAVDGSAPSSAVATLRYDYKDGRTYVERTAFTLVQEGGRLKIDRTSVLSSRQL